MIFNGLPPAISEHYVAARKFIMGFVGENPVRRSIEPIGLLTYVEYSLPVILSVWCDSKNYDAQAFFDDDTKKVCGY